MKKAEIKVIAIILSIVIIVAVPCGIYLGDNYSADETVADTFATTGKITETNDSNLVVFAPENPISGLIFYPGGKVEHTAYASLMKACADKGILCVLIEMPFKLAVFDINAADGIRENFPQLQSWYIGGHSLGGSMAAAYLEKNIDGFDGLVLLGSYSTVDFSQSDISALTIYGSEDKVLNKEKYDKNKRNLPEGFEEIIIDGGCHAYFGNYGPQDGDGTPTISNEEQIRITADAIKEFVKK